MSKKSCAENSKNKYRFPKKKYNEDIRRFIIGGVSRVKRGGRLLDAGCDTGYLTGGFTDTHEVFGIDRNLNSIEECRKNYPKGVYKAADLRALPFERDFFDAVVLNMVIEHLEDPGPTLAEIKRTMKDGGFLVLTTPNYANLLWVAIENMWFRLFERDFKPYSSQVHPSKFNENTLRACLLKHFRGVDIDRITFGFTLAAIATK